MRAARHSKHHRATAKRDLYVPPLSKTRLHPIDQAELDAWWAKIVAQSRRGVVRGWTGIHGYGRP